MTGDDRRDTLTPEQRERIRQQVCDLPPLTDEQVEGIAVILARSRAERLEASS